MENRSQRYGQHYQSSHLDNEISEESFNYSTDNKGNEILIMTIEIGDGITDDLVVHEDDKPQTLADQFCKKHGMGLDVKEALLLQIEENLQAVYNEEIQAQSILNESYENHQLSQNSYHQKSYQPTKPLKTMSNQNTRPNSSFERPKFENITNRQQTKQSPITRSASVPKEQPKPLNNVSNNGEKLYYKGLLLKDRAEKRLQYLKHVQNEQAMKEITFQPRTNSRNSQRSQYPELYLLDKGRERVEHLERKRGEKLAEEMAKCTFKPQIDPRSTALAQKKIRHKSPDRCVALYENAKVIEQKQTKYIQTRLKQECPFIPDTTKTQKINNSFTARAKDKIANSRRSIEEYINRSKIIENIDQETGQPLFHPRIGRPPVKRTSSAKEIGERLYSAGKRSVSQESRYRDTPKLANTNSERILSRVKHNRYRQLFELLSPNDGFISKDTVERSKFSGVIRRILSPLLDELAKLDEKLNYDEFFDSMEMLMRVLNPNEKNLLLMTSKPKLEKQEFSFKPSLNHSISREDSSGSNYK